MYPTNDLAALQREKLRRIELSAELRGEVTAACAVLARPVSLGEQVFNGIRRFAPLASFATSFFGRPAGLAKGAEQAAGFTSKILRWAPTVFRAVKLYRSSRQPT